MERNAAANVTSDCSNRKFQSMNLAAEIDRTGRIGYNEKNRRCEGVARHNRFTESSRRWNGDNRRRVNGSRRAGVNAEVASDGAFPLQKESMMVLKKRQRSAVKLGGNTERFVPKRVASCFYFTKMQNMYVYAQIVFRDHGKLFCVKIYFRR